MTNKTINHLQCSRSQDGLQKFCIYVTLNKLNKEIRQCLCFHYESLYLKLPKVFHYQASTFNLFCLPGTYILRQKVTKSTTGDLFLYTLPTRRLFCDRKLRMSTAGHLFLHTLPIRHLFAIESCLSPLLGIYFYTFFLPATYFVIDSCLSPLPGIYFYTRYLLEIPFMDKFL